VSLGTLKIISESGVVSKSGIMVGLGEKPEEVIENTKRYASSGSRSSYHWSIFTTYKKALIGKRICNP